MGEAPLCQGPAKAAASASQRPTEVELVRGHQRSQNAKSLSAARTTQTPQHCSTAHAHHIDAPHPRNKPPHAHHDTNPRHDHDLPQRRLALARDDAVDDGRRERPLKDAAT